LSEGVSAIEEQHQYSDIGLERMFHVAKLRKKSVTKDGFWKINAESA